jgi:hypothetical protein
MTSQNNDKSKNQPPGTPTAIDESEITRGEIIGKSPIIARIEELEALPHRSAVLHWGAFILSLFSLIILAKWVFSARGPVPGGWVWLDVGIGVVFAIEFFTRSGFRWGKLGYLRTRFFDFIAIVPALALVHHGFVIEGVWVWLILVARFIRVVDRLLGDGFLSRNLLALADGFVEEITDRVLDRILARIEGDMDRASFSHGVAEAFIKNKTAVLRRVREATPREGLVPELAHIVGLDKALERTEERTFDAVVGIIDSKEVDKAVRDAIGSTFSRMRKQIGEKTWRQHLGFGRTRAK